MNSPILRNLLTGLLACGALLFSASSFAVPTNCVSPPTGLVLWLPLLRLGY